MKECAKCRRCYDDTHVVCPIDDKPLMVSITCNVLISGRYLLEERLGKGGMGIVFKAKHKFLKSSHAIKLILPSLVEDDDSLLVRFKQEAILAASIDHPNVIRVTDFGVEDEIMPYLVMEYVDGSPLSSYLVKGERLTPERAFELFQPIALGVAEAHNRGITHRDLKPQNIMVVKGLPLKRAIKVLDFGLAKIKSTESFGSMIQAETMSNVIGSPPYMSPEQWENNKVDHRTDIYGLGVILYQMLTGNLPFQGDSVPSIMYQHLTADMPSFASHGLSLPPQIEAVVARALKKNREDRYNTIEEMLAEFEEALAAVDVPLTVNVPIEQLNVQQSSSPPENEKSLTGEETTPLSDSQKEKLYSYFSTSDQPNLLADQQLAQEFLQAQSRVEEARGQVDEADKLVQELAEAQRIAQQAQQNALEAKQRIEADVRRRVESEMESKMAVEQQARQKAEAESLEREAAARKQAEERANHLAQAALEAQQIAEAERKKAEDASRQRELEESVRRRAEIAAAELSQQVADAKIRYQAAKQQAEYESELRIAAEEKRQKIESELQAVAEHETELRKLTEAEAQKQIQEQASRFEREAIAAQERIEEARRLVELETQKREQAEAAKVHAEAEARRLADQISNFQKHLQEFQHLTDSGTSSSSNRNLSSENLPAEISANLSQPTLPIVQTAFEPSHGTIEIQTRNSDENFNSFLNTNSMPKRSIALPAIIAGVFAFLIVVAGGGYGFYKFFINKSQTPEPNVVKKADGKPDDKPIEKLPDAKTEMIPIKGGDFQMGRNDVAWDDLEWGDQFPAHTVTVKPFSIGKTEVSNGEYAEFMKETGHAAPGSWDKGKLQEGQERMPVTFVSLADAKAYTEWISKRDNKICRLPTEEEWEFVARNGEQQTDFPWGNGWRANLANLATPKAAEVGASADETMVGGVKDMMGNVLEWTSTKYALYPKNGGAPDPTRQKYYVIRGSSWGESENRLKNSNLLLTQRKSVSADQKSPFLGFRIVCQP